MEALEELTIYADMVQPAWLPRYEAEELLWQLKNLPAPPDSVVRFTKDLEDKVHEARRAEEKLSAPPNPGYKAFTYLQTCLNPQCLARGQMGRKHLIWVPAELTTEDALELAVPVVCSFCAQPAIPVAEV